MTRELQINLDDVDGHLIVPPFIDSLHYEPGIGSFVVAIVPDEHLSVESKLVASISRGSSEGQRIARRLREIEQLLAASAPIERVVHSGGARYSFILTNQDATSLDEDRHSAEATLDTLGRLRDIAHAAEIAWRINEEGAAA